MTLLAAMILMQAAPALTPLRAWKAHEGRVGTVLPLSGGGTLTAGDFGDETLRLWSPTGAKTADLRLKSPVEWAEERGGPGDLFVAAQSGDLFSLRGGTLKPLGEAVTRTGTHAGDPPRRVVFTRPVAVVRQSFAKGSERSVENATDGVGAHGGWTAAVFNGRVRVTDPNGRTTGFPFDTIVEDVKMDAGSRTLVLLTSLTVDNEYVPRLVALSFAGKRLWTRAVPEAFFTDLSIVGPHLAMLAYPGKDMGRAGIAILDLATGKPLPAVERDRLGLPRDPTALGSDAAHRRLAVGAKSGEVTLYDIGLAAR